MNQSLSEVPKVLPPIGTAALSVIQLFTQVQTRLTRLRRIRERAGEPGVFFSLFYTFPQHLYVIALVSSALAALAALLGGILKIMNVSTGTAFVVFYESYSVHVVVLTFLLLILTYLNGLSWIPIVVFGWVPSRCLPLKQTAAWYNLLQFAKPLEQPKPLFVHRQGIVRLADKAVSRMLDPNAGAPDFAEKPEGLSTEERANTALIGCLLEREHRVLSWKGRRQWRPFYAAIASARDNNIRMASPQYLITRGCRIDFYGVLRNQVNQLLPEDHLPLPDSAQASNDVLNAVKLLVEKYEGSASRLALAWWRRKPNLRIAFNRALSFYPFDKRSMAPQFLKLACRWDVWPGIDIGRFVYPYASSVGALMLDENALVTLDEAKSFAFQEEGELGAYRETMRRVVKEVERILVSSQNAQQQALLSTLAAASHPVEWELAQEVDFALWSLAGETRKNGLFKTWDLGDQGFVERKTGQKSA